MEENYETVLEKLSAEEPDYEMLGKLLTARSVPYLEEMAKNYEKDIMLATKAVYMASFFQKDGGLRIIDQAAKNNQALMQISAASTLPRITDQNFKTSLSVQLLNKEDPSVKKVVIQSIDPGEYLAPPLKTAFKETATNNPYPFLKDQAALVYSLRQKGLLSFLKDVSWNISSPFRKE